MKRIILTLALLLTCGIAMTAQTSSEDFRTRYQNLVKRVGAAGIGVETLVDRWEKAFPDDPDMLEARFNYYLTKSRSSKLVVKDAERFMGQKPYLSLKDSLDRPVNYFEELFYEDSLFALSSQAIDKAIRLYPDRIDLRFDKVTALTGYEKESPDMAYSALAGLIDYNAVSHPQWKMGDQVIDDETFEAAVQEYCFAFYTIGSPDSYEAFLDLSEKMVGYNPKSTIFLTNIGTYWLIAKNDTKKALKYYNKVLKLDPENYTAIKNCVILARKEKNTKLEKKYLPMLIKYTDDEREKASAETRLKALN
jgi:tetratricopeptide (TPR) repeat protein